MATHSLATFITTLAPTHFPPSTVQAARRTLYNYLGCALGGSSHPAVAKAYDALEPLFGERRCTLFGRTGARSEALHADAQHAALLNGIASHVHDYDDTHLATIIHPAGPVCSAVLAATQHLASAPTPTRVTGAELLTALVAGIETSCALGLAVWPSHYDAGWHITSTTGSVGAAAGVARLLGLSEKQTTHALGLAATQVTGLRCMFGSDAKALHPGRAAQAGLLAALLAQRGYTAAEDSIEAKRGWANVVVGGGEAKLDEWVGRLGREWQVERNAFKPFPCGIVCHPLIDACVRLRGRLMEEGRGVGAEELVELGVRARVHPLVLELTAKRRPVDGLQAKFSVYHGAAVALLYGRATPAEYGDRVVRDGDVVRVRDSIEVVADDEVAADATVVSYTCPIEGVTRTLEVEHAVGSLARPMTDDELTDKFVGQVELVLGRLEAARASAGAWGVGEVEDVAEVLRRL